MPTIVINGNTGTEFGLLVYGDPSYAQVRAVSNAETLITPDPSAGQWLGQCYWNGPPVIEYYNREYLQGFDLSAIPKGSQIISAKLQFNTINDDIFTKTITVKGFKFDFGTADISDYLSAIELSVMTPAVSYTVPGPPINGYVDFIDGAVPLKSVLVPGEMNRFIFAAQEFITGVAPTDCSASLLRFNLANSIVPPRLVIDFNYPSIFFGSNF